MRFQDIRSRFSNPSWLQIPQELTVHKGVVALSRNESKSLLQDAQTAIGNGMVREAQNLLYAGLLLDEQRFLADLQKSGALRLSRLSYVAEPLTSIVSGLLAPGIGLSVTVTDYLQSVSALYVIAQKVRVEYLELRQWLEEEREVGIKSALVWLDLIFLKATVGIHETSKEYVTSRHPFFFSIEEMAQGFSSLLALYGNEFDYMRHNPSVNVTAGLHVVLMSILNSSAHISTFREWEFQVDRLGYRCIPRTKINEYRFIHPSPDFHRSVEMGFIQTTAQGLIKAGDWMQEETKSFHDFAPQLTKSMEEAGLIELLEQPATRYRFSFPMDIFEVTAGLSELFLEERLALFQASRDLLTPAEQILDFQLRDSLTFRDLFQISRMILFIRSITAAKLIPEMETNPEVVFQSIVPAFERNQLIDLFSVCVGRDKAEAAVSMWTLDIKKHTDIQYWPLIPAGTEILLPANVFGSSNVYRNALHVIRKRLYEDGRHDPLTIMLHKKFDEKGFNPLSGFHYDLGEIDILVLIDGILFALECKNSLCPADAHELMTSMDYVGTAADQLERFKKRLADTTFRKWLSKKTGWPIDNATRLSTGIVLSNRMFMGWRENGHPVRGAYELEQFIDDGTLTMGEEFFRFWIGDVFTGEDFRKYLEEDITYSPQWTSMYSHDAVYEFDGLCVHVEHLKIDPISLAEQFGFEKVKESLVEQQAAIAKMLSEFSLVEYYRSKSQNHDVQPTTEVTTTEVNPEATS